MKRLIRWALNHVPRPLLQRLVGWAVPVAGILHVVRGRECPVFGACHSQFLPFGYCTPRPASTFSLSICSICQEPAVSMGCCPSITASA